VEQTADRTAPGRSKARRQSSERIPAAVDGLREPAEAFFVITEREVHVRDTLWIRVGVHAADDLQRLVAPAQGRVDATQG